MTGQEGPLSAIAGAYRRCGPCRVGQEISLPAAGCRRDCHMLAFYNKRSTSSSTTSRSQARRCASADGKPIRNPNSPRPVARRRAQWRGGASPSHSGPRNGRCRRGQPIVCAPAAAVPAEVIGHVSASKTSNPFRWTEIVGRPTKAPWLALADHWSPCIPSPARDPGICPKHQEG